MRRFLMLGLAVLSLALSGCATGVVRSNVTTFHQWSPELAKKLYAFQRSAEEEKSLEYQYYEDQVRLALGQYGLLHAPKGTSADLIVDVMANQTVRDVTVIEPAPIDPFWYPSPFYPPMFGHYGHYGYYGPVSPLWIDPWPRYQREVRYPLYTRRLHVTITRASDGSKVYEGTATNEGRNPELAKVMPYLIDGLFSEFPGPSGVPRRVNVKVES